MRKSKNIKRRTAAQYKNLKCQNSDPDTSKYAKFAPLDGPCTEVVNVPDEVKVCILKFPLVVIVPPLASIDSPLFG